MTKIKRLVAVVLSLLMIFGTVSSVASAAAWDATTSDGFALDVTTKIFRQVDGEWIETKKVQKGETVKARVYLDTDFFTNGGDLVFFYNNDFFSDSYSGNKNTLTVNSAVYAGDGYGITGEFYNSKSTANVEGRLMTLGVIDQDFADKHNFFSVSVTLAGDEKNNLFLGEEWLCEFDLTVNNDAAGTGDFFILKNSFRDNKIKTNYCNISKGPSFGYNEDVVDMSNWQAVITVASNPVSLYTNYVEATFDANGGEFADGKDSKVISGEAGEALSVDAPVLEGYAFVGWLAEGASEALDTVPALPAADTTYVAQWKSTTDKYDETLKFKTDIYRFDETANDWVYTEKVIPGETVKARIYIDTTYFTNAGDFVVFYDNDFFEEADPDFTVGSFTDLVVNPKEKNDDGTMKIEGTYSYVSSEARVIKRLVEAGHIDQEFADTHTAYLATYKFNPSASRVLSGDDYFAEWTLKVKDSASGTGDFFVVEETIQNASEKGQKAYISIPVSVEGGTDEDSISLFEINVNTDVESHPVSTLSRIEFYTDKAQMDTPDFVIEDDINAPVDASTVPEFTKDGYTFKGWVPAEIADPTVDDVVEIPELMPFDEVKLVALWIEKVTVSIDPSNGDPVIENEVTAGDAFEKPEDPVKEGHYLAGWTDDNGNFMTELPDVYPAEDTVYTAVFETYTYNVEYYVLNPETLVFDRVAIANTAYGEKINPVPPLYKAPAGYALTPAYKDITFAADSLLAAGETMPANAVKLYYKLAANKYPATFKLDGGNINGETADVVVETAYGAQIKAPADPVKKGNTFAGWTPVVGLMDTEPLEFIATWEPNTYYATFIVEGEVYEVIDIPYGAEFEYPGDPELPGYIFVEWNPGLPETMPDEDVELTAVFEKKDIKITLELNGGKYDGSEDAIEITGKYGDEITAPEAEKLEKEGYVFGGWEPALPENLPAENETYTAIWNPAKDTAYTVEVYYQDTEGNYADTPDDVIPMQGETDSVINVAIPVPYGFEICTTEGDYGKDVVIKADGSTVYKVYFDRVEYAIVFDGNEGTIGGEDQISQKYLYLSTVTAPADADLYREGYTFAGWAPAVNSEATKAVTYKAQWTVNSYDVIYVIKGETEEENETFLVDSFDFGEDLTVTSDKPEKTGYTHSGWTDAAGNSYKFPATMPAEDITVYAKFTPNPYKAYFFEEADSQTPYDIIDADFDSAIEAPASKPEKQGYEFGGWSTDGETPLDFENGNVKMDEENKNFVAVWTPAAQDVPVEYYIMGTDGKYPETANETGSVKSETDAVASIAPAEKANYTVDAEKSVLEAVVAADGSTVLKVYYKLNSTKLTITVDGEDTVIEGLVGSEVPAEQIPDTDKPGYTFTGWKDGEGNDVELPTTMPEKDATYEAQYEIKVYNVTFIVDGEVYDGPNETKYGAPIAVPSAPTKNGHTFAQWVDKAGNNPDDYAGMPDSDLEFTAEWTANTNIGYVLNVYEMDKEGNYPSEPTIIYTFNDGVVGDDRTVTPTVPEGFVLDIESINTPEKSELTGKIPATGTLTLKAYYTRQQFTLYLDVDGEITEEVYYFEQEIADRNDPVKKGWSFEGWQPDIPAVMPAEDVTVVAQFKKNSYTATFDAGEGAYTDGSKVVTKDVPYGESVTKPDTDPVKTGYKFLGWSTDGETVIENLGKMDDQGKTYIAVFVKSAVMVTFYNYLPSEKGPAVPEGQQTYVYDQKTDYLFGETIVFPADPVIVGHEDNYVFVGWVDADGNAVEEGATVPAEDFEIFAKYDRVKVMLIPKNDTCTTVIDRAGKTVDDYTADSTWYVYGLDEILPKQYLLNTYIDVQGDGTLVITKINDNSNYYGTGSIIDVYDNVTGELVESFRIIVFGDINGDSYANGIDLSIMSEEALGLTGWSIKGIDEYCAYKVKAADLAPLYGQIDGQDKALLNQHVLSLGEINQVTGRVDF